MCGCCLHSGPFKGSAKNLQDQLNDLAADKKCDQDNDQFDAKIHKPRHFPLKILCKLIDFFYTFGQRICRILCYLFSNNGYRSAVKEMWYGVERQDASGAAANMFPSEASSQLDLTEQTMETYLSTFQEHAARYGDNYHISIQFDDVEELDTEQLEQFNIWFQNLSLEKEVNKTYAVDYTRSISGKNGKESEHRFCYIYHYDGNWYVLDTALLGLQDPLA